MSDDDKRAEDRRGALKVMCGAGTAALAGALAAPAVVFVTAPARSASAGGEHWIKTIQLEGLREGEAKKISLVADQRDAWTLSKGVELGAVWLVRRGGEISAWSVVCPHLGCSITANGTANGTADGAGFGCPCHTSAFDAEGRRTGGPAPRDMDALATRIEDGFVLVDFRRYRMGTADRIEVG